MPDLITIPTGSNLNDFKPEIIKLVKEYLIENSLIDLTGFIHNDLNIPEPDGNTAFVRDIANRMKRTGEYDMIEQENGKRFLVYPLPRKKWTERNPFWHDVILSICAAVLTLFVGWLLQISDSRQQTQRDTQQETDIRKLNDSLKEVQTRISNLTDSINNISKRSTLNTEH